MLFSILVPVYNSIETLNECLNSVAAQTERDFELVLVDDGSTDGCGALCDELAKQFSSAKVVHQANKGLVLARRAGVQATAGEYCVFLDADDTIAPDTLAVLRETIERENADVVIYNFYNRYLPDETLDMAKPVFADGTVFRGEEKRTVYEMVVSSWRLNNLVTKAIRAELVRRDDTPFEAYAQNPHMEDLLQSLYPLTHASCIVYLARPLYYYRRNAEGISGRVDPGQIESQFSEPVMARLERAMAEWGMDTPVYRAKLQRRRIVKALTIFWQHFRAAKTYAEKRAVATCGWAAHIGAAEADPCKCPGLTAVQRIQLRALLNKRMGMLCLFALFGRLKLKALHGD